MVGTRPSSPAFSLFLGPLVRICTSTQLVQGAEWEHKAVIVARTVQELQSNADS
jgi:hypothetical protein